MLSEKVATIGTSWMRSTLGHEGWAVCTECGSQENRKRGMLTLIWYRDVLWNGPIRTAAKPT